MLAAAMTAADSQPALIDELAMPSDCAPTLRPALVLNLMHLVAIYPTTGTNPELRSIEVALLHINILDGRGPAFGQPKRDGECFPGVFLHCSQYGLASQNVKALIGSGLFVTGIFLKT